MIINMIINMMIKKGTISMICIITNMITVLIINIIMINFIIFFRTFIFFRNFFIFFPYFFSRNRCPNWCNQRGICTDPQNGGFCDCFMGFTGDDCSKSKKVYLILLQMKMIVMLIIMIVVMVIIISDLICHKQI